MKKSLIGFITKANQVLFFIAAITFIGFMLVVSYSFIFPTKYEQPKVQLIEKIEGEPEIEIVYIKEYFGSIKDVHIIKILANTINKESNNRGSQLGSLYSKRGNRDEPVNIIFIDGNGYKKKLFDDNRLIKNSSFANFKKADSDSVSYSRSESHYLDKNIFSVINKDSNHDGFLSGEDIKSLYLSDYNGENLKLIFNDILNYRLIEDNKLLVEVEIDSEVEFFIYDINLTTQVKLNTKI